MAVNNNIFTMATPNTETLSELHRQLSSLLRVGTRADGKYHQADFFKADVLNAAAKFKPFNDTAHSYASDAERLAARKNASYGSPITFSVHQDNANLYIGTRSVWDAPANAKPCRLRDFSGYKHNTKNAMALTTTSATITSTIYPALNQEDGYNISYRDMADMWTGLWDSWDEITKIGFVLYDNKGWSLASAWYTKEEFFATFYNGEVSDGSFNMRQQTSRTPVGEDWMFGVAATGNSGKVYIFPDYISVRDTRSPSYTIGFRINKWSPNMSIGTLTSGQSNWLNFSKGTTDTTKRLWYASNDLLLFGFSATNRTSVVQDLKRIRVKVSTNSQDYFYTMLCVWNYNTLSYPVQAGATAGVTFYTDFPMFYIDLSGFYQMFKPAANSLYNVSFQLVYVGDFANQLMTPISSELRVPMFFTGGAVSNPVTPNPSLKPTPPNWDDKVIEY